MNGRGGIAPEIGNPFSNKRHRRLHRAHHPNGRVATAMPAFSAGRTCAQRSGSCRRADYLRTLAEQKRSEGKGTNPTPATPSEANHDDQNKPQKPNSRRSFIQTAAMTAAPWPARLLPQGKTVLSMLTGDFDPLRNYPIVAGRLLRRSGRGTKSSAPRILRTAPAPAPGKCTCAMA